MDIVDKINANIYKYPWKLTRIQSIIFLITKSINNPQFADIGAGERLGYA